MAWEFFFERLEKYDFDRGLKALFKRHSNFSKNLILDFTQKIDSVFLILYRFIDFFSVKYGKIL